MKYNPKTVGELTLLLIQSASRYKTKRTCKRFRVNNTGTGELSQRQFLILFMINYYGVNTLTEIARLHGQTTGSLSIIISKMVDNGYITKKYPRDNDDGRRVYFQITPKGMEALKIITAEMLDVLCDFYLSFTPRQRLELKLGFELLSELIDEKDEGECNIVIDRLTGKYDDETYKFAAFFFKIMIQMSNLINRVFRYNFNNSDNMSFGQFHILNHIALSQTKTVGDLAQTLGVSQSTVSTSVSGLVKEGYLYKQRANKGEDGRKIYFYITEKGAREMQIVYNKMLAVFESYFNSLSEKLKKNLFEGVSILYRLFKTAEEQANTPTDS